jgi:hypothetical protein
MQGGQSCCFSPDGSCIALQLQLCLVRSSLSSKVGKFSFERCPLSHKIGPRIHHLPHFGGLACCSTPALNLWLLPTSPWCYQLLWKVCLLPHTCSQPSCLSWTLLSVSVFSGRLEFCSTPILSLCCFSCVSLSSALRVQLLAPTPFSRVGSAFHPHLHWLC